MPTARTTHFDGGVIAVDTEYVRPGLDASHLLVAEGRAAFVDTGANNAVPLLLDALARENLDPADVDYVFLTHIHLDHAGGAGRLMQALPNARLVVHPRGAPHMVDPSKLIAGTEAVYGKEAAREMYGVIEPVAADRVIAADDEGVYSFGGRSLTTLYTEGHARHHYVLHDPSSGGVFTGDSFGLSYREFDTDRGPFVFPTTTPIDFDPDAAHVSIDRIMGLEPERVFLTHYSEVRDLERLAADMHSDIDTFAAIAVDNAEREDRESLIAEALFDHLAGRLAAHGYDPGPETLESMLKMDVILNAQGLDVWLKRSARARD